MRSVLYDVELDVELDVGVACMQGCNLDEGSSSVTGVSDESISARIRTDRFFLQCEV